MKMKMAVYCLTSCLAFAAVADAQPGGGRRGGGGFGRTNIFTVAGNEDAQKDIGIATDEASKVKAIVDEYNDANRNGMRTAGDNLNFRDMTDDERKKFNDKMAEQTKANTEKYLPKLKDTLSADQFTRLQQITWQAMGSSAFTEAEIIKSLNITSDQQSKITSIRSDYETKGRELMRSQRGAGAPGGGGGQAFAEMREKSQALNKERDGKVDEVLTKDQLDKFATLVGKKFDVEKLQTFGRGPGGGGPGGGGGGGNAGRAKRPQPKAE